MRLRVAKRGHGPGLPGDALSTVGLTPGSCRRSPLASNTCSNRSNRRRLPPAGRPRRSGDGGMPSQAPGPALAGVLAAVDLDSLDGDASAEVIAGCERMISWAQARQLAAITVLGSRMAALVGAAAGRSRVRGGRRRLTVAEVAVTLTVSESSAGNRVALAGRLADLPATAAAFAVGVIDIGRVRAITEATEVLSRDAARAVEARVLVRAPGQTAAQLRRSLGRAVYAVDPAAAQKRHAAAATGAQGDQARAAGRDRRDLDRGTRRRHRGVAHRVDDPRGPGQGTGPGRGPRGRRRPGGRAGDGRPPLRCAGGLGQGRDRPPRRRPAPRPRTAARHHPATAPPRTRHPHHSAPPGDRPASRPATPDERPRRTTCRARGACRARPTRTREVTRRPS